MVQDQGLSRFLLEGQKDLEQWLHAQSTTVRGAKAPKIVSFILYTHCVKSRVTLSLHRCFVVCVSGVWGAFFYQYVSLWLVCYS